MVSVEGWRGKGRILGGIKSFLRKRNATEEHVFHYYTIKGVEKERRTYFCITTQIFFWFCMDSRKCGRLVDRIKGRNVGVPSWGTR